MESLVEGYSTPDFVESECSINIPGVKWNEETPRSFGVTPKPAGSTADQRIVNIPVSTSHRKSDTPRPAVELPTNEEIERHMCSQVSSVLIGKQRPISSTRNPEEDAITKGVYQEVSGLYTSVRLNSGSPRMPTPRDKKESNVSMELEVGFKISARSPDSLAYLPTPGSKSISSLGAKNGEEFENSQNGKDSRIIKTLIQADSMLAVEKDSGNLKENARRSTDNDGHSAPKCRPAVNSTVASPCIENGQYSRRSPESSLCFQVNSPMQRLDIAYDKAVVLKTPEVLRKSDCKSAVSDPDSVLPKAKDSVMKSKLTTPLSVKNGYTFYDSQEERVFSKDTKVNCVQIRSASSQPDTFRPESLVSGEMATPPRTRRGTSARRISSSGSHYSNGGYGDSTLGKDSHIPLLTVNRYASTPAMHSIHSTPRSTVDRISREDINSPKSADLIVTLNEGKICQSPADELFSMNVGRTSPLSYCDAHMQVKIPGTEGSSLKHDTRILLSNPTASKSLSGRASRIPVRLITPKVVEPANDTGKNAAEKNSVKKGNLESEHHPGNKAGKDVKKTHLKKAVVSKMEENTKLNALERRKAYEAKRTLERMTRLAKKSGKIIKKETVNKLQEIPKIDTEVHVTAKSEQILAGKSRHHIVEEKASKSATGEDCFKYEDDFEPIDEEDKITEQKYGGETPKNTGVAYTGESPSLMIQKEFANKDVNISSLYEGQKREKSESILLHNLMAEKKIHDLHAPMAFEDMTALFGGSDLYMANPGVELDKHSLVSINSCYEPPNQVNYTHTNVAQEHAPENTLQNPRNRKKKKEKRTNVRREKSFNASANNHDIGSKPPNAKKKITVGYVPGYGAVRVMQEDLEQEIPREKTHTRHLVSCHAPENQARPGRSQREIVGYVPGYGPVRGAPVPVKPEVASEKVILPPIKSGRVSNSLGDVLENRKKRGSKKCVDVLESRARAKPFNTYVDEEASKRFERQYNAWHY